MANTATFPLTGHTYTDDSDPNTGLDGGGHVARFVPALADVVLACADLVTKINTAYDTIDNKVLTGTTYMDAVAATVAQSASTSATSVTSMTGSISPKTFTLAQTGKAYSLGQTVNIADSTVTVVMSGLITAYNSTTGVMTVNVGTLLGAGTFSSWVISVGAAGGGVATSLATSGSPVLVNSSSPPVAKQLLTATSATTATWQDAPKSMPDFLLINAGII
jgi:hypothetical protein